MSAQTAAKPIDGKRTDAEQVLDILNRWDERMRGHQTQKRNHERMVYPVTIRVYRRKSDFQGNGDPPAITAAARNVSQKGIGFIYKGRIPIKRVVICLDPQTGETTWFHAEIVRGRQVHNDFWEYGARFISRATRDDAAIPSSEASR